MFITMHFQNKMVFKTFWLAGLLMASLSTSAALAHNGGLDKNGGHHDRKNGGYHCHSKSCFSQHKQSEEAVKEAVEEKRGFSYIYNRDDWPHWSDFDGDCMNTRHEILKAQADGPIKLSPNGCYVSTGVWDDPFSGKRYTRASDLDVDHILPLLWAHKQGGANWSRKKKEQFANDPLNLLAVDDGLNQQKGARGPSLWMPPNKAYHCEYIKQWRDVLAKYNDLKMESQEQMVFNGLKSTCNL